MRVDVCLYALMGLANASALIPRDPQDYSVDSGYPDEEYETADYKEPEYKEPEYKEPEYKEPEYKEPEPAYAPKDDYPDKPDDYKPAYAPKEEYPEKPAYDPKPQYAPKDDYAPYYPKDEYAPKDDYAPKDAYAPKDEYASKPLSYDAGYDGYKAPKKSWKPKTHHPEFFSLKVDLPDDCPETIVAGSACSLGGYAIRLEGGIVIATKYNKWWDPKLPIFFVDDDTQAYTVSKKPLQLYVDSETGALKYAPVGWLPPNSISTSFFKTGNNPYGNIGPSPAYFSWPTTEGRADEGAFQLCPTSWGQWQVFITNVNFGRIGHSGLQLEGCETLSLAAINANPWKKGY
ncbi:hypothetical protein FB567DRAFT_550017 [Paraphoma chrysanthemicola]|uniref:Uncharacterized protein n=1 Tax=Paraphoma chrysanthemicola TaxID=798071 RepID=A0A8K0VYL8_9PLEO|nr:hypothetical protein FB567DRAFT_550017 [Paraphoma chrysanthemicola]